MKKDHEDQVQRLKRLKDEEIDAVTSATSQTRSHMNFYSILIFNHTLLNLQPLHKNYTEDMLHVIKLVTYYKFSLILCIGVVGPWQWWLSRWSISPTSWGTFRLGWRAPMRTQPRGWSRGHGRETNSSEASYHYSVLWKENNDFHNAVVSIYFPFSQWECHDVMWKSACLLVSVMQDRLGQQQRAMAEERTRLKEVIAKMDTQLAEQQRQLEKVRSHSEVRALLTVLLSQVVIVNTILLDLLV